MGFFNFNFLGKSAEKSSVPKKEKTLDEKIEDVSFDGLIQRRIRGEKDAGHTTLLEQRYLEGGVLLAEDSSKIDQIKSLYKEIGEKSKDLEAFFQETQAIPIEKFIDIQWQLENACFDIDGKGFSYVGDILEALERWKDLQKNIKASEQRLNPKREQAEVPPKKKFWENPREWARATFFRATQENKNARTFVASIEDKAQTASLRSQLDIYKKRIIKAARSIGGDLANLIHQDTILVPRPRPLDVLPTKNPYATRK